MPDDYLNLKINAEPGVQGADQVNWPNEYAAAMLTAYRTISAPSVELDQLDDDTIAHRLVGLSRYAGEIRQGLAAGLLPRLTVDVPIVRTPWYDEDPPRAGLDHTGHNHPATREAVTACEAATGDADLAATATLPAPPVGSRAPQVCSTCGMPVAWSPNIAGGWHHLDAVLGADHDVTMEE